MCYVWLFCTLEELLLNRQVKSYSFLSGGTVGVDDVDDSDEFKMTEVSKQVACNMIACACTVQNMANNYYYGLLSLSDC